MREVDGGRGPGSALASWIFFVGCVVGVAGCASNSEAGHAARASLPRPALEDLIPDIRLARLGARERLGDPGCQAVLTDFKAVTGQQLDEVLRTTGRTAQEQLDHLVLQSGLGRPLCNRGVSVAFTQIDSPIVSICLRPFTLLPPAKREAVLIHEMLHSLGLGENPPESVAITARVLARCEH